MKTGRWEEIFRSGNYGDKGKFSNDDLDAIVANFNSTDQAPIVIGHPKTDSPAWGWLSEIRRVGDVLQGKPGNLHSDFEQALSEKKFKNKSVRIARTDKGPKLLHLGFLGATLPHVEGLQQAAQFDGEGHDCIDFEFDLPEKDGAEKPNKEDEMEKDQRIQDLEKKLADEQAARKQERDDREKKDQAQRQSDFSSFVENSLIVTGKLPKDRKDEAVAFMMSLPAGNDEKADFAIGEGESKKTFYAVQWFKDFASSISPATFTTDLPEDGQQDFNHDNEGKLVDLTGHV